MVGGGQGDKHTTTTITPRYLHTLGHIQKDRPFSAALQ